MAKRERFLDNYITVPVVVEVMEIRATKTSCLNCNLDIFSIRCTQLTMFLYISVSCKYPDEVPPTYNFQLLDPMQNRSNDFLTLLFSIRSHYQILISINMNYRPSMKM